MEWFLVVVFKIEHGCSNLFNIQFGSQLSLVICYLSSWHFTIQRIVDYPKGVDYYQNGKTLAEYTSLDSCLGY